MERGLGEFLVEQGIITLEQLDKARQVERLTRQRDLARVLIDLGLISEEQALRAKAALREEWVERASSLGLPYIDLTRFGIDPSAVSVVPANVATRHRIIPIGKTDGVLTVATAHPGDIFAQDDVRLSSGLLVEWVVADPEAIDAAIALYYGPV